MTFYEQFTKQEWELLKQRAKRVEKAVQAEDKSNLLDVLLMSVGTERYAIPVTAIQAVHENIKVHPLPSTPAHIAGIANVRGHVTTVLDISQILNTPIDIQENGILVLLALSSEQVALYVEQVNEVKPVSPSQVSSIQNNHETYIKGVLPDGTIFLDIQAIINDPSLVVNESS